ncbi:TetR/AcrR family transcriptional regulator [Ornithinimicrobium sufpigmenti]|uniref:TetR/AcrR family transcriptional regulator n=1 Tax=Ornithinimicrobium sufpigmenti TaxID=2508882 RepID=UPI0015E160FE|nr:MULTISPECIES: TetR/AcrR family transcriptional regulator [unclassified Ornithinimicrobium]
MSSEEQVLREARRLFGERGYAAVTIREVARRAGVSPALVMKIAGTKEHLYALATPSEPAPLPEGVPLDGLGEKLVSRMLDRRDEDAAEPWLRALFLIQDAPDPATARADFRHRFLGRFETTTEEDRRHADQVACMLIGLAAGLRSFGLLAPGTADQAAVVREYGGLIQSLLDRMAVSRS